MFLNRLLIRIKNLPFMLGWFQKFEYSNLSIYIECSKQPGQIGPFWAVLKLSSKS